MTHARYGNRPLSQRLLIALAALLVAPYVQIGSAQRPGEWRAWAADAAGTRYSPLDQINRDTVKNLRIAWRQSGTPDAVKAGLANAFPAPVNYENTPLMAGGLLYMSTGLGTVAALDPGTGHVVWFDPPPMEDGGLRRGLSANRGVAYWSDGADQRIITVTGQYLLALDAKTGRRVAGFGLNGEIDLRQGTSRPNENYSWRGAPLVINDIVVVGSSIGDVNNAARPYRMEAAPGDVRGYDVRTGKQLWTFRTIPRPGEVGNETWLNDSWAYTGHTNVWNTMTGDPELGHVYLPLTTPTNDWYGGHRPGANLFAESLVALDVKTGRRVWHFQGVHHGLWDYDFASAPILADITVNGRRIKAIAQTSKQAFLYVFDRTNGQPIWPIEERPVPQGDVPGEWYSPTQPVPLDGRGRPFAYDQQGVTPDDVLDFTPELRAEGLKILGQYAYGPIFFPPVVVGEGRGAGKKGSIHMPGTYGGTNWPGAAFDPETGILYVPSSHTPIIVQLVPPPAGSDMRFVRRGWEPVVGPEQLPLFKPPYGRLVAIDLNRGEIKWTVANGDGPRDHPAIRHLNMPPLGNPGRVGPTVTKSLVFMGEGFNTHTGGGPPYGGGKKFRAFDKATGEVVWEMELPGGATAPAMTYLHNGKQYIVVASGWTDHPGELIALALP
jgi:quinoprotein glucose dehydrogenase